MSEHVIDLNKIPNESAQSLIVLAVEFDWSARQRTNGVIILNAPHPNQSVTIEVPTVRQFNEAKLRTMARKIVRYGSKLKLAVFDAALGADKWDDKGWVKLESISARWRSIKDNGGLLTLDPAPRYSSDTVPEPIQVETKRPAPAPPSPAREPSATVLSERPWTAHRGPDPHGGGRVYPSQAVIERKWSDGSTDYVCSWPDCGWDSPLPQAVARHYGSSRSHTVKTKQEPTMRDPDYEPTFRGSSKEARAKRLYRELQNAYDTLPEALLAPDVDCKDLLEGLAAAIVDARDESHEDHDLPGPLTGEQILERIRRLVDDGSYLRALETEQEQKDRIATLEREIASAANLHVQHTAAVAEANRLRMALAQAQARAQDFAEQAAEAQRDWNALRELVNRPTGASDEAEQ